MWLSECFWVSVIYCIRNVIILCIMYRRNQCLSVCLSFCCCCRFADWFSLSPLLLLSIQPVVVVIAGATSLLCCLFNAVLSVYACITRPGTSLSLSLSLIWHKQIDWTRITRPQFAVTGLCLFVACLSVSHTQQRESLPELNHVVGGGVSQCHHHQVFTSTSRATCIKYTNSQSISRTCASVRPRALLLQA